METEEQKLLNSSNSSITALVPGGVVTTQNISTVIRPKGNSNSLQFVKIQTPELSKKAVEQIRIADETKISKEKIKEVEEEWQNNLLNWKSKRRQQLNHNLDLEPDQSLDNNNDCGTRKVKTFAEMIEQRAKSGNRLSFHLQRYVGTDEDDDDEDEKKKKVEEDKKEGRDDDEEEEEDDDDDSDDDGKNQIQNGDNDDQKKDVAHTSDVPVGEPSPVIDPPSPPTSQTTIPIIKQAPKPILRSPSPVKQASPTTLQPSPPVKHSPPPAKEIPQAANRTPIHIPVVQPSPPIKQTPSSKVQASPPVKQTSTIMVQTSHPVKQTALPVKPTPPPNKPVHPPVMRIFPPFKQTAQPIVQSPPPIVRTPPLVAQASKPIIQTPPTPPPPPVKQYQHTIKQTQSFVTQTCPVVKQQQAPSPVIRTSTPLMQTSPTVDQTPPPVLRNCPPVKHTSPPSTHSSPLRTPSISPKSEQNVVDAFPPEVTPPHKSQPKTNREDKDRTVLSVSGKKRCSSCKEELGRGAAAFVVESLSLVYHTNCFRCSVCHMNLSNGFRGVDVRVHAGALHCQNCYSKDGLSYSRV